ncbi:MAG: Do family serine endopeptidase [Muribaculaceae bacterium]|nr:Do family serine endopeptidase [Muribaculaceae bacterium]
MNNNLKISLIAAGVAISSSLATIFAVGSSTPKSGVPLLTEKSNSGSLYTVAASMPEEPTDFVNAAESTVNGVVSIKSYATPRGYSQNGNEAFSDPFFEFFFGGNGNRQRRQQQPEQPRERQLGLGSGVILSKDGYIVTNHHVIDGAERLDVTLNDNRNFTAKVIGSDPTTDLALIKIEADDLHVIPMGNSEDIRVGEWVLAVGNPFGFTSTVTKGIVSAKARNVSALTHGASNGIESFIQTDAAVNPGNSGGALVNLRGELVGINAAIYSHTGNFAGYSFAIPTSIVKKIVTDLKQYGTAQRAFLGIGFAELTPELAKEKGVTAVNSGIYVGKVEDRSAAFEAGIKEGDVITAIAGAPTGNTAQLQEEIAKHRPGDKVEITYYRDNKRGNTTVTFRNSAGNTSITRAGDFTELGCSLKAVNKDMLKKLELSNGVSVMEVSKGKFKDAGIKFGFIILDINNSRVSTEDDVKKIYRAIMSDTSGYDKVMFITGVYPENPKRKVYYAVGLDD